MKYLTMSILALIICNACHGQINIEKTFEDGELVVGANAYYDAEANMEYLITFDSKKQALNFYTQDYNLYKSVTNIFDGNQTSCMPTYLTRHLFNSDDKLEFLAHMTGKDGIMVVKIINEDGAVIKDFGPASSAYCIKIIDKVKLLVNTYEMSYNRSNPGAKYTSQLYSVPGKL